MDENSAKRAVLILIGLSLILLMIAAGSCNAAARQKRLTRQEIAKRMDLEAKIVQLDRIKTGSEGEIKEARQKLEESLAALEATRRALAQEQLISDSLKSELEKVSKLKDALEQELKDALAGKSPRTRR